MCAVVKRDQSLEYYDDGNFVLWILDRITGGNGNHIPDPVVQQGTQPGAFLQKAGTYGTSEKGAGTSLLKRIWI